MTIDQYDDLAISYQEKAIDEAGFRAALKEAGLPVHEIQRAVDLESSSRDSIGFKLDGRGEIIGFDLEQ